MNQEHLFTDYLSTPLGWFEITVSEYGVRRAEFVEQKGQSRGSHAMLDRAIAQFKAYFTGSLSEFDLPSDAAGTAFQKRVWQQLSRIPFGDTRSYSDIARSLQQPTAVRAVGAANGRNPIAVMVPCHRVIGANGSLTGYAGGLSKKAWLLKHESRQQDAF